MRLPMRGIPPVHPDLLDFHQGFVGRDAVALLDMDADHDAADRRLDLVFHLHGFDDQHAVTGLDLVSDLDLDVDDGAGHGGRYAALMGGARALCAWYWSSGFF